MLGFKAVLWPASCSGRSPPARRSTRGRRGTRCGPTRSASTARTTTTRCGQKAQELGVVDRVPLAAIGLSTGRSISSYVYNHVGMLGEGHHSLAKSLFLGGVTRRFPDLNFAFLEGGVAWAAVALHRPDRPLGEAQRRAMRRSSTRARRLGRVRRATSRGTRRGLGVAAPAQTYPEPDAHARRVRGVRHRAGRRHQDLFADPFYCGCEADDPMTATAFNTRGQPVRRRAQRHVRLRHLALGRPRHGRRARRGVGDGRARLDHRGRLPTTSCSPTRCASTPERTPTFFAGHRGRGRRSPRSSPRTGLTVLDLVLRGARDRRRHRTAARSTSTSASRAAASSTITDRSAVTGRRVIDAATARSCARASSTSTRTTTPSCCGIRRRARRRCTASRP